MLKILGSLVLGATVLVASACASGVADPQTDIVAPTPVPTTPATTPTPVTVTRVPLPAYLDTSGITNLSFRNNIYGAALEWFNATDGGVDLLSGDGQSIIVLFEPLSKNGWDGLQWQADGHFYFAIDQLANAHNYTSDQIKAVAIHEIGHVLGLGHSTTGIMQPCATCFGRACVDAEALALVCVNYTCGIAAHSTCYY